MKQTYFKKKYIILILISFSYIFFNIRTHEVYYSLHQTSTRNKTPFIIIDHLHRYKPYKYKEEGRYQYYNDGYSRIVYSNLKKHSSKSYTLREKRSENQYEVLIQVNKESDKYFYFDEKGKLIRIEKDNSKDLKVTKSDRNRMNNILKKITLPIIEDKNIKPTFNLQWLYNILY